MYAGGPRKPGITVGMEYLKRVLLPSGLLEEVPEISGTEHDLKPDSENLSDYLIRILSSYMALLIIRVFISSSIRESKSDPFRAIQRRLSKGGLLYE